MYYYKKGYIKRIQRRITFVFIESIKRHCFVAKLNSNVNFMMLLFFVIIIIYNRTINSCLNCIRANWVMHAQREDP